MMAPLVVDAFSLVGPSLFGSDQPPEALRAAFESAGVNLGIVAANRPLNYELPSANAWLADMCASSAGRFLGIARVDPNHTDAVAHARLALETQGLRGLFLHPHEEVFRIDEPRVDAVVSVADERGVPVVISAGWPWQSEALQIAQLAQRHSQTWFIMTNGGQFNISGLGQFDAQLALRRCPNIALLTNGVYRQDFIEGAVAEFGPRRVLYASGSPQFEVAYELLRVRYADVRSAEDRALMLGGAALELFGLQP